MRLTKKFDNEYHVLASNLDLIKCGDIAINKLGQLEDIEEELGIDLITLFKALKNGIYFKTRQELENGKIEDVIIHAEVELKFNKTFLGNYYFLVDMSFKTTIGVKTNKDYGKTWALTKEELE